ENVAGTGNGARTLAADTRASGIGGGLGYTSEAPLLSMTNQEHPCSCTAACARQLLLDAGVDVPESVLRQQMRLHPTLGITADNAGLVLNALHPRLRYDGGGVDPSSLGTLVRRDPFIAYLHTDAGTTHSIIVDKLEGNLLHVRDPWGVAGPGSGSGTQ